MNSTPSPISKFTLLSATASDPRQPTPHASYKLKVGRLLQTHWKAALHVLRYLQGTKTLGLMYVRGKDNSVLEGFCDSDYAGCPDTRQSTLCI